MNTLNLAPTASYSPSPLQILVTNLPEALMNDQPLAKAFVAVIERWAMQITGFGSKTNTRLHLASDAQSESDQTIHEIAPNVSDSLTVYIRELEDRAVSRMLSKIIREHVVGKTCAQLAADPFSLVAYEQNRTHTGLIAAWSVPSFFVENTLNIYSKVTRNELGRVAEDGVDEEIYGFNLVGPIHEGEHLFDEVNAAIVKGSLFSNGYVEQIDSKLMGEEKTFTDATIKAFEPGQD